VIANPAKWLHRYGGPTELTEATRATKTLVQSANLLVLKSELRGTPTALANATKLCEVDSVLSALCGYQFL
jgi:hypothetical protein